MRTKINTLSRPVGTKLKSGIAFSKFNLFLAYLKNAFHIICYCVYMKIMQVMIRAGRLEVISLNLRD